MFDEAGREILARLRHACARASQASVRAELAQLPGIPAARPLDQSASLSFLAQVIKNGGSCAVANGRRATVDAIGSFVAQRHGQRRVVCGHDPRLAALPWRDGALLPRFGVAADGDAVAVSYAQAAVAETGSVLLWRNRNNPASNSLLVEDHIVIVEEISLVQRLEDAVSAADYSVPETRPRACMLISGPSSTADIEMQLVVGAHGPLGWHVILVGPQLESQLVEQARLLAGR